MKVHKANLEFKDALSLERFDSYARTRTCLVTSDVPYVTLRRNLTEKGRSALQRLNVQLDQERGSKRLFAFGCLDWTERRHHLGGFLGKAILESLLAERIVEKPSQRNKSRAISVRKPIAQWMTAHENTSRRYLQGLRARRMRSRLDFAAKWDL